MGFRINTNIGALNAHANSVVNARELDKSLSRLSSGLRINSAADDASGMAIADSLRSQAATLGQAINNGNDAIGILQTADKAMDEQLKILDTIKTKATQAAQDGQSLKTRTMLQADINRLMEELDNIANTTSFNGKQLLSGNFINQEFQIGASSNQTIKATIGATQSSKIGLTRFETGGRISSSGEVQFTLKNYNGIDDFQFQKVVISTSVGTGLGALVEEINKSADQTGVRATFTVETRGMAAVRAGTTSDDFAINGVKIGQVEYKDGDANGALVAAINSVKDTTGVEASIDANGQLLLSSREGRGIKIEGNIGRGAFINPNMMENYGRLSLVKNDGKDILVSGTGLSFAGFGANSFISQASVSLRESKGRFDANTADAMGFGSVNKGVILGGYSSVSAYMSTQGSGFSAGSGYSVGSGKNYSTGFANTIAISAASQLSAIYNVSAGSGFSSQSGLSQFATMKTTAFGVKDETAGVTTLKGAMAVMDIAETATTNLDQIRADIGSVQNQLQVTINNITVTQVNVKAAESTIRDVDFAAESANFSKYNILAQSGSYAMSQANAVQQNVLKLLQ
ncbi:flagellin A [Campylobacter jejuni]|uniref:flagellin A n=2 Tax=Campylobacter jejuni TaxID=197 RepID=UPI000444B4B6|nr:flagellin A [Campylobacter jejuni]AHW92355.1 flagellin [Campylobacter jejuni subsp. jejuni R14]AYA32755.1 flagellin A [Campylobacter jejuni subsp. jejuni]EAI1690293.1 flagellin A [Campylobacter jejuni]EAJ4538345.1 flagellin A [Campylobacter jejuni]EAJ9205909.1 flagellin A [Campylobacter jejuni]